MQSDTIRIGTRGSRLALVQAEEVKARLCAIHDLDPRTCEIVAIKTTGDRIRDRSLSEVGGKGLFTKEIEAALGNGEIDLAVHSMKDMPTALPDGFEIAAILEREDPRDGFISPRAARLLDLPEGAVVGTSSLRRAALARHARPDLRIVNFRGNVETRLGKLRAGEVDASFLAVAGLRRLGMEEVITDAVDPAVMLPAIAQGAIGIEIRSDDAKTRALVETLDHHPSSVCVAMERAFLESLDGSCQTPIAGLATLDDTGNVSFAGAIVRHDGSELHHTTRSCGVDAVREMGADAGLDLKRRGGPGFFSHS